MLKYILIFMTMLCPLISAGQQGGQDIGPDPIADTVNTGKLTKVEILMRALENAKAQNNLDSVADILVAIGTQYASKGDMEETIRYYSLAKNVAESVNNYAVLDLVYYDLAILYMDLEIYPLCVEYFEKSRNAHIKAGNFKESDVIEYDLTIQVNRQMLHSYRKDTLNALAIVDSLNNRYHDVPKINNFAGQANISMGICDANLKALKYAGHHKRNYYINNARLFLDMLDSVIVRYNEPWLRSQSYNYLYAQYLMACGKYVEVRNYVDSTEFIDSHVDRNRLRMQYYTHLRNYRKVMECMDYDRVQKYSNYSVQKAANYENQDLKLHYQALLQNIEHDSELRNTEYELQHRFNVVVIHLVAFFFVVMIAIILTLSISHHNNNRLKVELEKSNVEIIMQNQMMNQMQEETTHQNDEILSQNHIIESQRDDLAEINHLLKYSINLAANIQKSAVYDEQAMRDNIGECFVMWKPLFGVSGDFYWGAMVGNRQILVAADCTGHGVPGALLSMYGISMLNDHVRKNAHRSAADILNIIKDVFMQQMVRGDKDFMDGMDCALLIINRAEMTVDYAGARRPLLIISNGEAQEIKPDRISIGYNILRNNASLTNHTLPIAHGDMLYVYSDGIADQFGGDDGATKFGNSQLKDMLAEVSFLDTSIQKTVMESVVENWMSGPFYAGIARERVPQLDDQLLIGVRV